MTNILQKNCNYTNEFNTLFVETLKRNEEPKRREKTKRTEDNGAKGNDETTPGKGRKR